MSGTKAYSPSLNIIVFSKDRACQLDLFLTSMHKMFREYTHYQIHVLYTASNKRYEFGYKILKSRHKYIHLHLETDFKDDLLSLLEKKSRFTVFFVDDIVWKEAFTIDCNKLKLLDSNDNILCLSLRLDGNLTYCYAFNTKISTPLFDKHNIWDWHYGEGDFGYPMSLDGHIFRTLDIYPLLDKLEYQNPNTLELALSEHPIDRDKMISLTTAPIFNMPINKVQAQFSNHHGNITAEYLNNLYILGCHICLKSLIGFKNYACHQEVEITIQTSFIQFLKNTFSLIKQHV